MDEKDLLIEPNAEKEKYTLPKGELMLITMAAFSVFAPLFIILMALISIAYFLIMGQGVGVIISLLISALSIFFVYKTRPFKEENRS